MSERVESLIEEGDGGDDGDAGGDDGQRRAETGGGQLFLAAVDALCRAAPLAEERHAALNQ